MRIVTIGAGSIAWGPTINIDFLLHPALDGAELVLMDIDPAALDLVRRLLDRLIAERGLAKTVLATTDLETALRDADFVLTAISVGGDRLWRYDAIFPQIYGVFQPVGDTIGPGGMLRALRHAGPLLDIGRTMLRISRPGAPLLQLTNPMNPLCSALEHLDGLPIYGICHGVDDTEGLFAGQHGLPKDQVRITAAGNNHHIYCSEVRVGDTVYGQDRLGELVPLVTDGPFRTEVFRRYGGLVANHRRHPIEFLPGFIDAESDYGRAWDVDPLAQEIDPLRGSRQTRSRSILERALDQRDPIGWREERDGGGLRQSAEGKLTAGHSREVIDDFIAALAHGDDFFIHLNLPNRGAIAGVDSEANVEIPVTVRRGSIERTPVRFNDAITQEIDRVAREQLLLAQACVAPEFDLLVESLSLDALVPDRALAERLVREMTAFQADYLPAPIGSYVPASRVSA